MKKILFLLPLFIASVSFAQTKISGKITDGKMALVGVSVSVKDSYDGATTNADGVFNFETSEKSEQTLMVTYVGFNNYEQKINCSGSPINVSIILKEKFNELKAVTITAGSFDASDKKRATIFTPLDIVTTAGSQGDVTGALKTMPGAQQIGNQEGLFVRGGEGRETQTFIDGMLVRNPYNTSVPDISQRGKFNPFLFKGTSFSSGGYSALYGQGLSSALILDTKDLAEQSETNLSLSSVGIGGGVNHLWEKQKMSAGVSVGYFNLQPYYALVPQNIHFTKMPENGNVEVNFRKRMKKSGFLKFYAYANNNVLGLQRPDINDVNHLKTAFDLNSKSVYTNLTYTGMLNANWNINAGASFSNNNDKIKFGGLKNDTTYYLGTIDNNNSLSQGRVVFTRYTGALSAFRIGGEYQYNFEQSKMAKTYEYGDNFVSTFAEMEYYFNNKLVIKPGARFEYSSIINKSNIAPRLSVAYRLGRNSQLSFAYGDFYEKSDRRYLLLKHDLDFEKATHFVLNYQRIHNDKTLRVEAFYKDYKSLILTPLSSMTLIQTTNGTYAQNFDVNNINNGGKGYAKGVEFFLRDKKTIKNCDYWISYSLLDTKRKFSYYPDMVQPDFAATHTLNLVFKQFFPKLMLGYGITYNWASGRPYYNPNQPISNFMSDRTQAYNALGINANYLTHIGKAFTVLVLGVSNALGNQQVFGYRYSTNGQNREAIGLTASRFVFVGCFMNWGVDRRKQQVDDNLK
ncbi:MAG: hypothetical protein RL708_1634 [Bacteroidota bacterium]|jgi:hypothetical protein